MRQEHVAPLPEQAIGILQDLRKLSHPEAMVLPAQSLKIKP